MKTFKFLIVVAWTLFLGIHTFTDNLEALLGSQIIEFRLTSPDFSHFFSFSDITLIHPNFILIKTGHFLGFAIMDLLLFAWLGKHGRAAVLSFGFAVFTEVMQLYFGRDGRLYDVIIDTMGIISVYVLLKSFKARRHESSM
ncbi:VanZ family protein [Fictibacillus enclensis]|uniref:VanZ family protein n=1 Tax=Fictibacillus enclensis TaxID=1017270 RepID=UPI0024C002B5|nr:VanZ family protein [Fictibacillus enclensis]WHY71982.1 VanZ family protein [Fictibacillus enclensis]